MTDKQSSYECQIICWVIAALVGLVAMVLLYMMMGFDGNQAFFSGALIGLLLGIVLSLFLCRGQTAAADLASGEKPAQRYAREAAEDQARRTAGAAPAAASSSGHAEERPVTSPAAPAAAAAEQVVKPSKPLPGQAELASRKGDWKYEADGDKPGEVNKSKAVPAGETAAPAAEPSKEAKTASKPPAAKKPEAAASEAKPATLYDAPPAEGADDLKLISGVGPKLEQTLNDLGIYRFEQVASWGASEIAWVDNRLKFKGRIQRDDWMSQAKTLAEGGQTEFSSRKKK